MTISNPEEYLRFSPDDSAYAMVATVMIGLPYGATPSLSHVQGSNLKHFELKSDYHADFSNRGLVEIAGTSSIRGRKTATINFYPLIENGYYGELEIKINFTASTLNNSPTVLPRREKTFDAIFSNLILNYESFKNWPIQARTYASKTSKSLFNKADTWYKITANNEGIVKVTGADLRSAGIILQNLDSDSLHLFYGGGEPLPVQNSNPRPVFKEIAIKVFDGNDGLFDLNDYFLFFAESADRWRYPTDSSPVYVNNPYTDQNHYWLASSGDFGQPERVTGIDGTVSTIYDSLFTDSRFYFRTEQNNILAIDGDDHIRDFYNWYWSNNSQFTFFINPPNLLPFVLSAESTQVRIHARASNTNTVLTINSIPANKISTGSRDSYFTTTQLLPDNLNGFLLSMQGNYGMRPYFDYCELTYRGELVPEGNRLDFAIEDFTGIGRIKISNEFSISPTIFDLSDPGRPQIIENPTITATEIEFNLNFNALNRRFYLSSESAYLNPSSITQIAINDLRNNIQQTDMIVIAPENYMSALADYVDYRGQKSGVNIMLVSLDNIINQFSYGLYDPTAIRDFLKYAYENYPAPAPSTVLLVGDGNYDFENNLRNNDINFIPPYVHRFDNTSSDDNYIYFGDFGLLDSDTSYTSVMDRGYDMIIGRWPVKNVSQIAAIFDKVRNYESSSAFGTWRSTVTLVSDDEYTNLGYEGLTHTEQTERLQREHLPPVFLRNKIYLWEYPYNSLGDKPDVNKAIIRSINDGALLINYVGHGNPDTWAHEHVFNRSTDLQKLTNTDKLTLFFAASCSIGFFDDPGREGMAEELLRNPAGAIAVISATRLVYSQPNSDFNRNAYDFLFDSWDLSIAQAVFAAKLLRQYYGGFPHQQPNDRAFAFFGDPLLKLAIPQYRVRYEDYPDEFTALAPHYITGEIIDAVDSSHVDFTGEIEILVFDSEIGKIHRAENDTSTLPYSHTGPVIYRGSAPVINGILDFSFIAPLDIGYGGAGAKIFSYANSGSSDGIGLLDSITVSSEIAVTDDTLGPEIKYSFSSRNEFISGDPILPEEILVITLTDSTGLNLTGGFGHGISLTIDNNLENIINLTDLFQYERESHTQGVLRYEIEGLAEGIHSFKVKAWDNANNSSSINFNAEVVGSGQFLLTDLLNYPNPMEASTTFSFILTGAARQVNLEVFTLSGKKIFSYKDNSIPADFYRFYTFYTWDGNDLDGDRVAAGVYIYKVTALSMSRDKTVESYGKVVVIN